MTFWVAGAVVVGGALNYAGSQSAAGAQESAANNANKTQWDIYQQQRTDQAPWRTQGQWGLNQLQQSLARGFSPGNLTQDPGYQFGLTQGQQGLDRSAAARGRFDSGAQLKASSQFNSDYAGTKYNDAYNRWITQNNELAGLAGVGQTATNATGQAGQNYANQSGQNTIGAGNAAASGYLAGSNSLSNALNQYSGWRMAQPGGGGGGFNYAGGGNGTGAWVDPNSGATYNNPSAYMGP